MLRSLYKARTMLVRRGIWDESMAVILTAMLLEGIGYAEALQAYADFKGVSRWEVEAAMEAAARSCGHWTGCRYILEECYREGIRCEPNIC